MRPARQTHPLVRIEDATGGPVAVESGRTYPPGVRIRVDTGRCSATVVTEGYVSGVAAGSLVDRATGARDLGFGLAVVDFLLEPADLDAPVPEGQYHFNDALHGRIAKRYVEGPQICTQARQLPAQVFAGDDFAAVKLRYRWNVAYPPRDRAGSVWEQTLIFPRGERYFLAADRVTTVSESPGLFFRVDMPGHIRHEGGREFRQVYLSYHDPATIPSAEFRDDFPPDARFLYRREAGRVPRRIIRAYQVGGEGGRPGPWLAGITLDPDQVYQAWCHQRGYVCMIQELGGRPTRPGDTLGAAYAVGWFDDVPAMEAAADRYRGLAGLEILGPPEAPSGFQGIPSNELTPVPG